MKNRMMKKGIILLFASSMLLGCSSRTSIKPKQAMQILDMIIYEQSKEDFSRGNEISLEQKESNGEGTTRCLYELSEKNNIIHVIDKEVVGTETWYYVESTILYSSYRDESTGTILTVVVEENPEIATKTFGNYFTDYKLAANKKINEVDKPVDLKEYIDSLSDIDSQKLKAKYQTKKDYNLKADITIYEDIRKRNQLSSLKFEFSDSKIVTYTSQDEEGTIIEYVVDYTNSITRDSIK